MIIKMSITILIMTTIELEKNSRKYNGWSTQVLSGGQAYCLIGDSAQRAIYREQNKTMGSL